MDDIFKNVSDEELLEMAVIIKLTYSWNSKGNNWDGHHYIAPNGWKIETSIIPGPPFSGPDGEEVYVYDGERRIKRFSYSVNSNNPIFNIIQTVQAKISYTLENKGYSYKEAEDISTAVGEYVCAIGLIEKNLDYNLQKPETEEENKAEAEKLLEEKKVEDSLGRIPIKRIRIEWKNIEYEYLDVGILFYYENFPILIKYIKDERNYKIGYTATIFNNNYSKEEIIENIDKNILEVKEVLNIDFNKGNPLNKESKYRNYRIEELMLDRSKGELTREIQFICEYIDSMKVFYNMSYYDLKGKVDKISNIQLNPREYHSYDYKDYSVFAYHFFEGMKSYPYKITFYIYKQIIPKDLILDGNERLKYPIWDEITYSLDGSIDNRFSNYYKKREKFLSTNKDYTFWDIMYKIECEIIDKLFNL